MAWVWSGRTMAVSAGGLGVRGRGTRLGFSQGSAGRVRGVAWDRTDPEEQLTIWLVARLAPEPSRAPEAAGRNLEASAFARRCGRGAPPSASTG